MRLRFFCCSESPLRLTRGRINRTNRKKRLSPRNRSNRPSLNTSSKPEGGKISNASNVNSNRIILRNNSSSRPEDSKISHANSVSSKTTPQDSNSSSKPEGSKISDANSASSRITPQDNS